MSAVAFRDGREPGAALRWTAATLLIAGVHAGAGWWLVGHAFAPPPPPEGVAGVTVELDPVSVPVPPTADPKPREDSGPGPDKQAAERPDVPSEPPPAVEPPPSAAEEPPAVEPPPPVEAAVAPPPDPAVPDLPPKPDPAQPQPVPPLLPEVVPPPSPAPSDAVLPPPPPPPRPVQVKKFAPPKPPKPVPPKPDPREVARQEAREAAAEARQEQREQARAKAAADARAQRQAARAAATREGGGTDRESAAPRASGASVSDWHHELLAHIAAYKPNVDVGSAGTARVTVTIDRGGRVVSVSLAGSSGDGALDQAAVSMMHRASPVPAPPPELGRQTVTVPVHFH